MSKSPMVIAGLGIAACALLSLMMKQAISLTSERAKVPYAEALEARFGQKLAAPLQIRDEQTDAGARLVVLARFEPGVDAAQTAAAIGAEVWMHATRAGTPARELVVVERDAANRELRRFPFARPAPGR
ncbi:MAG: hypothetical protein JNL12_02795 [Planctomycetes bacterium]|nr:hypothetical protein [Planctomycetota bacterium]